MQFSGMPAHISFVWLPAGLSLAALLFGGLRLAPGIVLGSFARAVQRRRRGPGSAPSLRSAVRSPLWPAPWLLQRKLSFSRALDDPRDVLSLIAVGAFLSPIIAATFGATGAYWGRLEPSSRLGHVVGSVVGGRCAGRSAGRTGPPVLDRHAPPAAGSAQHQAWLWSRLQLAGRRVRFRIALRCRRRRLCLPQRGPAHGDASATQPGSRCSAC